ncbi:hypothetical protein C0J52_00198 [Blattella germanica]|nr:hypothetical protein C0J52_00198 [Blattella germanica]
MRRRYRVFKETCKSIHAAVRLKNLSELYKLIEGRVDLNAYDDHGFSSLHYAVIENRPEIIEILIGNGADPNVRQLGTNDTPVYWAVALGRLDCVRTLALSGASLTLFNSSDVDKATIHLAAKLGKPEIVKYLLDMGVSPNFCSLEGWPPIIYGLEHPEVLEVLVRRGADVNYVLKSENGFTALLHAICSGYVFSVQKLLQMGAHWFIFCSKYKFMAVHWAAKYDRTCVMDFLVSAGADLSAMSRGPAKDQPIHIAAESNHANTLGYLMNKGISIETTNSFGYSPLHLAVSNFSLEAMRFLIRAGANIDCQTAMLQGHTPLHLAATKPEENVVSVVSFLITEGANWKLEDHSGSTPVQLAIERDNIYFLDEISKHVALNVHLRESDSVRLATRNNSCKALKWLLARGVSMEKFDDNGILPIHLASEEGFSEIVVTFLDHMMNVNARTSTGETPLHYAVYSKQDTVAELLLAKGADINAMDIYDYRPDHIAAMVGNINYFKLVQNEIDITSGFAGHEEKELSLHSAARCGQWKS